MGIELLTRHPDFILFHHIHNYLNLALHNAYIFQNISLYSDKYIHFFSVN